MIPPYILGSSDVLKNKAFKTYHGLNRGSTKSLDLMHRQHHANAKRGQIAGDGT